MVKFVHSAYMADLLYFGLDEQENIDSLYVLPLLDSLFSLVRSELTHVSQSHQLRCSITEVCG